jgi:hypothetical protein
MEKIEDKANFLGSPIAEQVPCTAAGGAPRGDPGLRVRPEQVVEGRLRMRLHATRDEAHLVQSADSGREPTVDAQNTFVDNRCDGEAIEEFQAPEPRSKVPILLQTFFTESIGTRNVPGFVISTEKIDSITVARVKGRERRGMGNGEKKE